MVVNNGPIYDRIMNGMMMPQIPMNPMQRMNLVMQAMQNPAAFVRQKFPDIPDNIANDPGQILQYLQRTRNISDEQLNQTMNQIPRY